MDLHEHWPLPGSEALRDRLLAAYADPGRGYHDTTHLREVLDHVDGLREEADEPTAVVLAAWFHDAVHEGRPDDEERSAQLAEATLAEGGVDPGLVGEVARLVRLTADHRPAADDRNGAVLCDADLAILAEDAPRYAAYVEGVRREYSHLDDATFRRGRAEVLGNLLAKPHLFHTRAARELWEARARANVTRELERLRPADR